jgi:hypothetical protein
MHISYMQGRAQAYLDESHLNPFNDTTINQRHHLYFIVCRTFCLNFIARTYSWPLLEDVFITTIHVTIIK